MKKKVYIISHSHWDREWYMAYEQHHMRLIELIDDLLELFEVDPVLQLVFILEWVKRLF